MLLDDVGERRVLSLADTPLSILPFPAGKHRLQKGVRNHVAGEVNLGKSEDGPFHERPVVVPVPEEGVVPAAPAPLWIIAVRAKRINEVVDEVRIEVEDLVDDPPLVIADPSHAGDHDVGLS